MGMTSPNKGLPPNNPLMLTGPTTNDPAIFSFIFSLWFSLPFFVQLHLSGQPFHFPALVKPSSAWSIAVLRRVHVSPSCGWMAGIRVLNKVRCNIRGDGQREDIWIWDYWGIVVFSNNNIRSLYDHENEWLRWGRQPERGQGSEKLGYRKEYTNTYTSYT